MQPAVINSFFSLILISAQLAIVVFILNRLVASFLVVLFGTIIQRRESMLCVRTLFSKALYLTRGIWQGSKMMTEGGASLSPAFLIQVYCTST